MKTIADTVRYWASQTPEQTAIVSSEGETFSYAKLSRSIDSVVSLLAKNTIERTTEGPRLPLVAMVFPSNSQVAIAFLGVSSCAIAAPLNPDFTETDFEFYLSDLNPQAVLIHPELAPPARQVAQALRIPIIDFPLDHGFLAKGSDSTAVVHDTPNPADVALILYTSGTTSRPKQVSLTHANLSASAHNIGVSLRLGPSDRCLNMMPLFHIHGIAAGLLAPLTAGGSIVVTPGFDADQFFSWLKEYRPTWYSAVPTIHQSVLALAQEHRDGIESDSLRFIRSSSASLAPSVMRALEEEFGVPVIEAYGMTEAAHQIASNPLPPAKRKPGTVGIPVGVEVRIVASGGGSPSNAGHGEIAICGENVTHGYGTPSDGNVGAFVDGWFRTGDEGYIDEEGYLHLTGRIKEMINRGGEKIAPSEIDEALLEHPAIEQVLTFAIPHPTLGEDVGAAVTLHDGADVNETELRTYLFQHLADFKIPTQILIVDEIPQGPTGKARRLDLAQRLGDRLRPAVVRPETVTQEAVCRIWKEVLGVDEIGILDNFFTIGGDSLSAARVLSRVNSRFNLQMSLRSAFEAPRLLDFAQRIEEEILTEIEGSANDGSAETGGMRGHNEQE